MVSIFLYVNRSDAIVFRKDLNYIGYMDGDFKEPFDVLHPSIMIERPTIDFNYIFITDLTRFYFVDSFECIATNLWLIRCSIDVLETYHLSLPKCEGLIERSSSDFDSLIIDECAVFRQGYDVEVHEGTKSISEDLSDASDVPRFLVVGNFLTLGSIFQTK